VIAVDMMHDEAIAMNIMPGKRKSIYFEPLCDPPKFKAPNKSKKIIGKIKFQKTDTFSL
jgi:hypothetical protein